MTIFDYNIQQRVIRRQMINRDKKLMGKHYKSRIQRKSDFVCHPGDKLANRCESDFQLVSKLIKQLLWFQVGFITV